MSETVEREPLAEAFFQLRLDAPHEIVAPGAPAARRTLRRRRLVRMTGIAVLIVLAVAGFDQARAVLGGSTLPPTGGNDRGGKISRSNLVELQRLSREARSKIGLSQDDNRMSAVSGPIVGVGFSRVLGAGGETLPKGRYELSAACEGAGAVDVVWSTGDDSGKVTATCGQGVARTAFNLPHNAVLALNFVGDATAQGHAGAAAMVTHPLTVQARTVLAGFPQGELVISTDGFSAQPLRGVYQSTLEPDTYTLTVACAGTGELVARIAIDEAVKTGNVSCTNLGSVRLSLRLTKAASSLDVVLDLVGEEKKPVGYAYRVSRG